MANSQKKGLENYPLFSFRTRNPAEKSRLDDLVDAALDEWNSSLEPHLPRMKKNQIIVDALEQGLGNIRATIGKRKANGKK